MWQLEPKSVNFTFEEKEEEKEEVEDIIKNKGAGGNIITTKQTSKDRLMQNME